MQRFRSERWNWWPQGFMIVAFSALIVIWLVRMLGGTQSGLVGWLYVAGFALLVFVGIVQLRQGVTIDDNGVTQQTLLGSTLSPWDRITELRVEPAEVAIGKFTSAILRARGETVITWPAVFGSSTKPVRVQARVRPDEVPALLLTVAQAPTKVVLDLPQG